MPIRFRCRYCNQLMGIARRKAGMTVQCPTCHAQLVVPQPEPEDEPASPAPPPPPPVGDKPAPIFERSDFEDFLHNPTAPSPAVPPLPSAPPPPSPFAMDLPSAPALEMSPASPRAAPPGLLLSPAQATWLTVAVILLVALAFGAGLLVGHYWIG
jgi:hypothetical protein